MDGPTPKIAITAALVGLIITAAVLIELARTGSPARAVAVAPSPPNSTDRLERELARCNRLGPNDGPDQACLDAWAAARRHFLGGRP